MKKLMAWLFAYLQKRCTHNPSHVAADILEGETPGRQILWCRRCGAWCIDYPHEPFGIRRTEWRIPRADWY